MDRRSRARRGRATAAASAAQARRRAASRVRASAGVGRLDLGRRQQVGERVQVVADADPALGAGLEGRRPASGERIEDDVASARVAGDEGVGKGGREAREIRAHRVERVAPQPLLVLPLGRDRQGRQLRGEVEGELSGADSGEVIGRA